MMSRPLRVATATVTVICTMGLLIAANQGNQPEQQSATEFARATIDLGMTVSDLDKAARFYRDAIGFREVEGFSVPGDFCADAGLTSGEPLKIRVFVLGDGESATKLKLMQVPGSESKKSENQYINSQLGYRYLTIYVNDTNAAMKRLQAAGVSPAAKTPVALPEGLPQGIFLTVVHDPDGNIVELVGPKK